MTAASERNSPQDWALTLSAPPVVSSDPRLLDGGLLRRWTGTASEMHQPALDHHYLVLHLGGPKRVRRQGDGGAVDVDLSQGQLSVAPAGSMHQWRTDGPIDFAHLYISPRRLERVIAEVFDREPRGVDLQPVVGHRDELLEHLVGSMLREITAPAPPPKLYVETLFTAALVRLVRIATDMGEVRTGARHALAPFRLRRVEDFVETCLADDLDLDALAQVAGLSRFHFSRAFQQTTGCSPYLFLTRRRIARAKQELRQTARPIAEIGRLCGFRSPAQFSSTFKKMAGLGPREWRGQL